MKLKLYGYWRSSASWRVRWALELKKIPFDYIPVNLLQDENRQAAHLARHPLGLLPALEIAPDNFLGESLAILWWLEDNFAQAPLFGADRTYRYKILELCELINADTAPLQSPRVQKKHSDDPQARTEFAKYFIREGLSGYQKSVQEVAAEFSVGTSITAADLYLIPQLYNARRFEIDIAKEFPLLAKIEEHCLKTAECRHSAPESQSDAV